MSRSPEAKAYDKVRIRYEIIVLENGIQQHRVGRATERLDYERHNHPGDRNSIRKRQQDLDQAYLRLDQSDQQKEKSLEKVHRASRALEDRRDEEYTLMRQRGYAGELADQISGENNRKLDDGYYQRAAQESMDSDQ